MTRPILTAGALALGLALAGGPAAADRIEQVYDTYCAQCHGVERNGNGINLPALSVKPRDHTDAKAMGSLSDEAIFTAIKGGGLAVNKSILMPAWGSVLSDGDINEMVSYLRRVCKC